MRITACRINHLTQPLGYDLPRTVFSWQLEDAKGTKQQAARLMVCEGEKQIFDTGWAQLDPLAAELTLPLKPRTRYTWTVSARTDAGDEAQSEANSFETAKMDEPWAAKWIGCDETEARMPVFTKHIEPKKPLASARLYICGLGLYDAYYNGQRIGDERLTPYFNNYNSWVQYQTYDVTGLMQTPGDLSVTLGNGFYLGRTCFDGPGAKPFYGDRKRLIAEIVLSYLDGSTETIITDESWTVSRSAICDSSIYDGETRDDTLPEAEKQNAILVDAPKGALTARVSAPVRVQKELKPISLIHTPAGELVLDVGQNITGSFRLRVHEPKGVRVHLQVGEILQNDNFYRDNLRSAKAEYIYVSDGQEHILEPRFTFYGYRYVKVEGIPGITADDFTALVMHTDLPKTGTLETGHRLVNRLIENAQWGQLGNFVDVPTDCPQRDERMGWTGDAQVFAPTACYQRDCYHFYEKYLRDMASEQAARGGEVPFVVPAYRSSGSSAAWGDAACVIPWVVYTYYGDKAILEAQFDSMCAWVDFVEAQEKNDQGWRNHFHFGDWLAMDGPKIGDGSMGGTDNALIALVYFRYSALLTMQAARVLGKADAALHYEALADSLLKEIRNEYMSPAGRVTVNTQTAYLLALGHGITQNPGHTAEMLLKLLMLSKGKLQTGFVGTPLLCRELCRAGYEAQAFRLLLNEDMPGWLYEVKMGATTVWERWNSVLPDGSISDTGMNSLNHYAYGSIVAWLYESVAGIAPMEPGFKRALLEPHVSLALGYARAEFKSASGLWRAGWSILPNGDIRYRCTVPFGCTALLRLPSGGGEKELTAGDYDFTYTPDKKLAHSYSSALSVAELLDNSKTAPIVLKYAPRAEALPSFLKVASLRRAAKERFASTVGEKELAALDEELGALDEEWRVKQDT